MVPMLSTVFDSHVCRSFLRYGYDTLLFLQNGYDPISFVCYDRMEVTAAMEAEVDEAAEDPEVSKSGFRLCP